MDLKLVDVIAGNDGTYLMLRRDAISTASGEILRKKK